MLDELAAAPRSRRLGVDGVFSDFPDTAVTARELLSIDD